MTRGRPPDRLQMVFPPLLPPKLLTHLCSRCSLPFYRWENWGSEIGIQLPKTKPLVLTALGDRSRPNSKARVLPIPHHARWLGLGAAWLRFVCCGTSVTLGATISHTVKYKQWNNELWRAVTTSFLSSLPLPLPRVHNKCPWSYFWTVAFSGQQQPGETLLPTEERGEVYQRLSGATQAPCHPRTTNAPSQVSNYPCLRKGKRKELVFIIFILQRKKQTGEVTWFAGAQSQWQSCGSKELWHSFVSVAEVLPTGLISSYQHDSRQEQTTEQQAWGSVAFLTHLPLCWSVKTETSFFFSNLCSQSMTECYLLARNH